MIIGIFSHFFAVETTLAERQFFRALARLVGKRSARLSACGIAAIVSKMGYLEEGCAVGADGSLYNVSALLVSECCLHVLNTNPPSLEIPRLCRPCARRPGRHLRREGAQHRHLPRRGRQWYWQCHRCRYVYLVLPHPSVAHHNILSNDQNPEGQRSLPPAVIHAPTIAILDNR